MVRYSINYKTFRTFDGQRWIWIYSHVTFSSFFLIIWVDIWVEARVHILRLRGVILLPYYYKLFTWFLLCAQTQAQHPYGLIHFVSYAAAWGWPFPIGREGLAPGLEPVEVTQLMEGWVDFCPGCSKNDIVQWDPEQLLFSLVEEEVSLPQRRSLFIIVLGNEARALSKVDKDLLNYIP